MAKSSTATLRCTEWRHLSKSIPTQPEQPAFPALKSHVLDEISPAGLKRGTIVEIFGRRSTGRTAFCSCLLAQATEQGEVCAVVDLHDTFHPASALASCIDLQRILWIRCRGSLESALRASDLLMHAGGFGIVYLDLCEATSRQLNKIPVSYWHRFRRVLANTPTILLVCANVSLSKSISSSSLQATQKAAHWLGTGPFNYLDSLETQVTSEKISLIRPRSFLLQH